MEERSASLVAIALGGLAICGFWAVRPTKSNLDLRVVDQWTPSDRSGPDGDAAALFRISVKGAARYDETPISYQIVGAAGNAYPLGPASTPGALNILKLTRGFPSPLDSPRLVAMANGRTLGSVPLRSLPRPEHHPLVASLDPPVALVQHGPAGLFAEPTKPIPKDERWRIVARGTPFREGLDSASGVGPFEGHYSRRLDVPFADEAGVVEVDLTRYRLRAESEIVQIKGMRLERRFGGTALVVDRHVRVPNGLGAEILLPAQDNGPRRAGRYQTPPHASANLVLNPPWLKDLPTDLQRGRGPRIQIISPSPESLGLRELRIGPQSRLSPGPLSVPVREGEFPVTARITFYRPIPIETRRWVVPVTVGQPFRDLQSRYFGR